MIDYTVLNLCPFDYTAVVVSGKAWIAYTCLTPPVGWLSLIQLTVLNHCVYKRSFGGVFVLSLCLLDFICRCKDFCHRTESDFLRFLFVHISVLAFTLLFLSFCIRQKKHVQKLYVTPT